MRQLWVLSHLYPIRLRWLPYLVRFLVGAWCSRLDEVRMLTLHTVLEKYPDVKTARLALRSALWPDGDAVCPYCNSRQSTIVKSNSSWPTYQCQSCEQSYRLISETPLQHTRLSLQHWFFGAYLVAVSKGDITVTHFGDQLGIGRNAAWRMLRTLRDEVDRGFVESLGGLADDLTNAPVVVSVKIPKAAFGSADRPLQIGSLSIPCYVLDDGRRVLSNNGLIRALGTTRGGGSGKDRLTAFTSTNALSPYVSDELAASIAKPIRFKAPNRVTALGYEATVLAGICDAVLAARSANRLDPRQAAIAANCEILMRGFATIGIIALIDEVTGYQEVRARDELNQILEKYIAKELLGWAKRFPDEFYKEMFRLRGWKYDPGSVARPGYVGKLTREIVYARLPPGILEELEARNPPISSGRRKHKHHQYLTEDVGHENLRNHLVGVIALMRASTNWPGFMRSLNRAYPRSGTQDDLPLDDE